MIQVIIEIEGNTKKHNFDILNTLGQVVYKGNLVDRTTVQTTNFLPGIYLVKFGDCKICENRKFIKQW
ncbi:MAG: T9SS type A sorting domain-containing protein [Candidatus Cloacimonetes bacterium]|nr:T9SS type A sorting domain-containing protein [Candidatus Cloacimonadota bacterium]